MNTVPSAPATAPAAAEAMRLDHDLRAALSDLLGGLDAACAAPGGDVQLQRARAAAHDVAHLGSALAALAAGTAPAAETDGGCRLGPFLDRVAARWTGHGAAHAVAFSVARGPGLPEALPVAEALLERILGNLIGNAMKTPGAGSVRLAVSVRGQGAVAFVVRDRGPGFSAAALARLFQPGARGGGDARPGQGMGLHIAHRLAGEIGGRIEVRNPPDGGAAVSLILPVPCASLPHAPAAPVPDLPAPDLSGRDVLIVEDSVTMSLLLARMVEGFGARVTQVTRAGAALAAADERHFDLALVDAELPDMAGERVIAHLRAGAGTAVLAVTAHAQRPMHERLRAAGAGAVLTKPLQGPRALAGAIAALELPARTAQPAPFDELDLDRLLALPGAEGRELLSCLRSDFADVAAGLAAGLKAGGHDELHRRAHVLVSLAGAVGAHPLARLAGRITEAARDGDEEALGRLVPVARRRIEAILARLARRAGERMEA